MNKIRVLHIKRDFNVYTGLVEILNIMAKDIDQKRFDLGVCVFRYDGNIFGEKFRSLGGEIFNLNVKKRLCNEPKEFIQLYKFMAHYKPDIVQTHVLKANFYGILAARLARVPVIIGTEMTLKDIAPSHTKRIRDSFVQPLLSASLRYCDKFVVTSEFIKEQWYHPKYSEKFETIYPPFNLSKYQSVMNNFAHVPGESDTNGGYKIGYVGRLSEEKGLHFLIRSMARVRLEVPSARLIIVGTGPLENELKDLATNLGLSSSVHFVGYRENVFEVLRDLDLFVLPSRTEGCPIVVLEAMAMGLPVIATQVGGTPELVVDGQTGILVPYDNPNELAAAVTNLLQDEGKARLFGTRGRDLAFTKFHPSQFVSQLENLYLELYFDKMKK